MDCVPRKMRIDNMSTAIVKAKSKFEEQILTKEFQQFAMHYGFEVKVVIQQAVIKKEVSRIK